jgi:hypothetical protein
MISQGRLVALLALVLGAAAELSAQSSIQGRVWELRDGRKFPLEGALVLARVAGERGIVARAESLADGSYLLGGLPGKRLSINAFLKAHYVVASGGREASSIPVDCQASGRCAEIDFELTRGAVIEGYVLDEHRYPVPRAQVSLFERRDGPQSGEQEKAIRRRASDDLGYFRIWGLEPGSYRVEAGMRRQPQRRADPVEVELDPARRDAAIQLTLKRTGGPRFTVGGRVSGLSPAENTVVVLQLVELRNPAQRQTAQMDAKGLTFEIRGAPAGDYIAYALEFSRSMGRVEPKRAVLGRVSVDRDHSGLELSPQPDTGVTGNVLLDDAKPNRMAIVELLALDGSGRRLRSQTTGPGYRFEHLDLLPGRYQIRSLSSRYYVREPQEFTVLLGQVEQMTLKLSSEFGVVEGSVRDANGESGGIYLIGLSSSGMTQSIQTDQNGGFVFANIVPGDYRIAAWGDTDVDPNFEDPWEKAGELAREFALSAGDQVEITLTAAEGADR